MHELHFLRPAWLLAIPVFVLVYWLIRRQISELKASSDHLAPHLLAALLPQQSWKDKFKPLDLVAVIAVLVCIAASGPAWYKQDTNDTREPPVVLVLKVSPSMLANDFEPTRLARAKLKIRDFLALRGNAKTALIAYAGSSHRVLPMTGDQQVFLPFIEALAPDVMPGGMDPDADDVAQALAMAQKELEQAGGGAIVLLADGLSLSQVQRLTAQPVPFIWWQFATEQGGKVMDEQGAFVTNAQGQARQFVLDEAVLTLLDQAQTQSVTVNDQDLIALQNKIVRQARQNLNNDPDVPWQDMAWYFTWPALVLVLYWFRRGFTTPLQRRASGTGRVSVAVVAALGLWLPHSPQAEAGPVDWFLTRDQQGHIAFNRKEYAKAADLFTDPMWQGTALYKAGKYQQAAQVFARVPSAEGMFNRANALLKAHLYQPAVTAYEQVLNEKPDYPAAQQNFEIAKAALALIESQPPGEDLEQNLTTEVDDKEKADQVEGDSVDYQVADSLAEDAKEQWMRSVDSDMSEFLKTKFASEARDGEGQ